MRDTCLLSCVHFLTLLLSPLFRLFPLAATPTGEPRGRGAPTLGLSSLTLDHQLGCSVQPNEVTCPKPRTMTRGVTDSCYFTAKVHNKPGKKKKKRKRQTTPGRNTHVPYLRKFPVIPKSSCVVCWNFSQL